jgi:hypothetical protein
VKSTTAGLKYSRTTPWLCRAVRIFKLALLNEGSMQIPHRVDFWSVGKRLDIEAQANLDVFMREVLP